MRTQAVSIVFGLALLPWLTGCTGQAFAPAGAGLVNTGGPSVSSAAGAPLAGNVRGGQQPIVGAHVYMLAANTTGYGGSGIAASISNASVSLLTGGTLDSSGGATNGDYYVTTDASGSWTITGDYACTPGQQVYLYAQGGDPGAGQNAAVGLMAALGACPAGGAFASTQYVVINEVSTVALAYAFAGFATDATHVSSSGTPVAVTGIANAFASASNLETLSTGMALSTTPAGSGTVPQAEINTLADILANCVNSTGAITGGTSPTACYTLFTTATADGTSTGAQPADTATAAINIAHHPAANAATLFALAGATPPFAPVTSTAPRDWTIALSFNTTALTIHTLAMALDAQGNVWLAGGSGVGATSSLAEFSNTGTLLSGSGYSLNGYTGGIAVDPLGNLWAAMYTGGVYKLSSNGSTLLQITPGQVAGLSSPSGIAIDGFGNAWIGNSNAAGLFELRNDGTVLSPTGGFSTGSNASPIYPAIDDAEDIWTYSSTGTQKYSNAGTLLSPSGGYSYVTVPAAIDGMGNVWSYNSLSSGQVFEISNAGTLLSPTSGYSVCNSAAASPSSCQGFFPGASEPPSTAVDGAGDIWVPAAYYGPVTRSYYNGIVELSNQGNILSGNFGYQTSGSEGYYPSLLQVDASGNLWGASPSTLVELVGAAVPVVTPLSEAVALGKLGARP